MAVLDREMGGLSPGNSSKVIKQMLHVQTPRKGSLANTIESVRNPEDLRKWELFPTAKGIEALKNILAVMNGRSVR